MTASSTTTMFPELLDSTGVIICGISTRMGGVSPAPLGMNLSFSVGDAQGNVATNRQRFFRSMGIEESNAAIPVQVHGNVVKYAREPGRYDACDGLITDVPRVWLCVSVADCVPVFILDTRQKVVAAIHAGWRGTSSLIVHRGLTMMAGQFGSRPDDMRAFIGPCASACCYSVGADVAEHFQEDFIHTSDGKIFVDLKAANASQLVEAGISRDAIEVSPYCTIGDSHLFHSYRRDKEGSGRMMGVIGLR